MSEILDMFAVVPKLISLGADAYCTGKWEALVAMSGLNGIQSPTPFEKSDFEVLGKDWIIERQEGIYRPWIYGDFDWRALPFIKDDDIDHMGIERVDETPNMGRVFQSTRPQMKIGAADTVRKNFMLTKQGRAVLVVPAQFLKILGWQQGTFVKTSVVSSGEIRISPDEISADRGRTLVTQGSSVALIYPENLIVSVGINPESSVDMWIENNGLHVSAYTEIPQTTARSQTATVESIQESVVFKDLGYELLDGGFSPEEADSLLAFIESKNNILKMDPDCEFEVDHPYVHVSIATIPRAYTIFNDNGLWKMVFTRSIRDFGIRRVDEVKRHQVAKELLMNGSDPNSLPDLQRLFSQWDHIHREDATNDEFALIMDREYEVGINEFSYVTGMGYTYAYEWDPKLEQWFWADDKAARDFKIRRVDEIKWQKLPGEMLAPDKDFGITRESSKENCLSSLSEESGLLRDRSKEIKTMAINRFSIKEFFEPQLKEGPRDPAFKPPVEVEPPIGDEPPAPGGAVAVAADQDPMLTQDTATEDAVDMRFFVDNAEMMPSELMEFVPGLTTLAEVLDNFAFEIYSQIQDPQARINFKTDYQKMAADWSKSESSFLQKVTDLKKHMQVV